MEHAKKGLKPDKKFRDFKIQALKDSSTEDEILIGLDCVKKQVELLAESGFSSIKKCTAAMKAGDFVLAKKSGVRSAELAERRQYYLDQGARLAKILSRKTGRATIIPNITKSSIKAQLYDPGCFATNKERESLERGFSTLLKKKMEDATPGQ